MIKSTSVLFHPLPLVSIIDYHMRRNEKQKRIVGALLGKISSSTTTATTVSTSSSSIINDNNNNIIEVEESFAVPISEDADNISIGSSYFKKVIGLSKLSYPDLEVVGWFTTTPAIDGKDNVEDSILSTKSCMIHEIFCEETSNPIHVVVNTSGNQTNKDIVRAFNISTMELNGKLLAAEFRPINIELASSQIERMGVDLILRSIVNDGSSSSSSVIDSLRDISDVSELEATIKKLLSMHEQISAYIDLVVSGKIKSDHEIGHKISKLISRCPKVKSDLFIESFNKNLHDLLSIIYLSDLVRTQMAIGEKIGSVL